MYNTSSFFSQSSELPRGKTPWLSLIPYGKLCSCCGWKKLDLKLTDRIFECKMCDMKMDRDLNAILNLKQIYRESSSRIDASGDGSSLLVETPSISPSLNEEFNKKSRVYILKL
jgi:hypothetical protein